ncbi:type-2 histone deacetylase 2-like [Ceratitis capitata]|nr:type-2 histone deacetylase 2-like [Ceratitis capitata]
MTQPRNDNSKEAQQEQGEQEQIVRNGSSNEFPAEAMVLRTHSNSELFVIESDSTNRLTFGQGNRNIANEIQTLAANVAADSVGAFSVDDVLILHYEPNNNNNSSLLQNMSNHNNNSVDNQLTHFSGILIRNKNNNNLRSCNRFDREQLDTYQPNEGQSSNSGNFDTSISTNNADNLPMRDDEPPVELESEADDEVAESVADERINDNGSELSTIDLTTQNNIGGLVDAELQNMEFNRRGRNRPLRHGWSRRRHRGRNRRHPYRRNQIGRTLRKMNTILRKTALTLGLLESLILQQRG